MSKKQTKLNLSAVLAHCRGRFIMLVAAVVISAAAAPARAIDYVELAKLIASDATAGDRFSDFVALSGNTALVGAHDNSGAGVFASGSAYLFDVTTGSQIAKLSLRRRDRGRVRHLRSPQRQHRHRGGASR